MRNKQQAGDIQAQGLDVEQAKVAVAGMVLEPETELVVRAATCPAAASRGLAEAADPIQQRGRSW